jgi:hypothetical protein
MSREIHRDHIGVIRHDEAGPALELEWLEGTAKASPSDIKEWLLKFVAEAEKAKARSILVDLNQFRFEWTAEFDGWWKQNIFPRYVRAGVQRFAFVFPTGHAPPTPSGPDEGYKMANFDSLAAARAWCNAKS